MYYGYFLNGEDRVYVCATTPLLNGVEMTEEEYIKATTPTEEEIKAARKAELQQLMAELQALNNKEVSN